MSIKLSIHDEDWGAVVPFRVANNLWETFAALVVEVQDGDLVGRGEAEGVYYFDETPAVMAAQVREVAAQIEAGASRVELLELLPPGGARNAVDAALWDLEAKRAGKRVWEMADVAVRETVSVFTIGFESEPEAMAAKAAAAARHPVLKIKLTADRPVERVEAIRRVRPDATLVIDANEAWDFDQLRDAAPRLADGDARGVMAIRHKVERFGARVG